MQSLVLRIAGFELLDFKDPRTRALLRTATCSSTLGLGGAIVPSQREGYGAVRRAIEVDNAQFWALLKLLPVLKLVVASMVVVFSLLVSLYKLEVEVNLHLQEAERRVVVDCGNTASPT